MALTQTDWILAAGQLLAKKDIAAVKVEPLAKILGVSKGSFYWHFANRDALLAALLDYWKSETQWLIDESLKAEAPLDQLVSLFTMIGEMAEKSGGPSIDSAIFRWAAQDANVAGVVHRVEAQRLNYLQALLEEAGLPMEVAIQRAELMYLSFLGYTERAGRMLTYRSAAVFERFGRLMIHIILEDLLNEE